MIVRCILVEGPDRSVHIRGRHGVKYISFLCMLIWPLVDVYYVCCTTLMSLQKAAVIHESALVASASARAEASYYKGPDSMRLPTLFPRQALTAEFVITILNCFRGHGVLRKCFSR